MEQPMSQHIIYRKGLHIVAESGRLSSSWPPGTGYLTDQLRRASSSIVLNFSEGLGRSSRKERERFFTIARGSARETQACLDVAHALGLIEDDIRRELVDACVHISFALRRFGAR
jgi:four helix bundle protein